MGYRLCGWILATALFAAAPCGAAPDEALPRAEVDEPHAFGYVVGDLVERRVRLHLPRGLALDESALPEPGRRGHALELRRVELGDGGRRLTLVYQVFAAPAELRLLELPPLPLTLRDAGGREQSLRIDAWPLSVGPLAPETVFARRGLGELRPDTTPPSVPTAGLRTRLLLYVAAALLPVGVLLQAYLGWWPGRRPRPFGRAWRALKRLPAAPTSAQRRDAFRALHDALNRSAGEVVFAAGVGRFVAAQPRFAALRGELDEFFRRSDAEFFAGGGADDDNRWLQRLGRACRDAERGST